jgi:hypothetical protein
MQPPPREPGDAFAALQLEIAEEKASAMGRVAEKLEGFIDACARLAGELRGLADDDDRRARLLVDYEHARREARLHYWYLIVQRECIGLFDHGPIARLYPIPPRIS